MASLPPPPPRILKSDFPPPHLSSSQSQSDDDQGQDHDQDHDHDAEDSTDSIPHPNRSVKNNIVITPNSNSPPIHLPPSKRNSCRSRPLHQNGLPSLCHHHTEQSDRGRDKRKEQNRNAQRAFRERKEKKLQELQEQVNELVARQEPLQSENENLKQLVSQLKSENQSLALYKHAFTFSLTTDLENTAMPLSSLFQDHKHSDYLPTRPLGPPTPQPQDDIPHHPPNLVLSSPALLHQPQQRNIHIIPHPPLPPSLLHLDSAAAFPTKPPSPQVLSQLSWPPSSDEISSQAQNLFSPTVPPSSSSPPCPCPGPRQTSPKGPPQQPMASTLVNLSNHVPGPLLGSPSAPKSFQEIPNRASGPQKQESASPPANNFGGLYSCVYPASFEPQQPSHQLAPSNENFSPSRQELASRRESLQVQAHHAVTGAVLSYDPLSMQQHVLPSPSCPASTYLPTSLHTTSAISNDLLMPVQSFARGFAGEEDHLVTLGGGFRVNGSSFGMPSFQEGNRAYSTNPSQDLALAHTRKSSSATRHWSKGQKDGFERSIEESDQMHQFIDEGRISEVEVNGLCELFKTRATCKEKQELWGELVAIKPEWNPVREEFKRCAIMQHQRAKSNSSAST